MTEKLTPKIKEEKDSYIGCIKSDEESGHFEHAAMNYEKIVKIYEGAGDIQKANEARKSAMINYEKAMWFDDALALANYLGDSKRADVYKKLDNMTVFSDDDKETRELFRKLDKMREN